MGEFRRFHLTLEAPKVQRGSPAFPETDTDLSRLVDSTQPLPALLEGPGSPYRQTSVFSAPPHQGTLRELSSYQATVTSHFTAENDSFLLEKTFLYFKNLKNTKEHFLSNPC